MTWTEIALWTLYGGWALLMLIGLGTVASHLNRIATEVQVIRELVAMERVRDRIANNPQRRH